MEHDYEARLAREKAQYENLGFSTDVGMGGAPALLVIDMQEHITRDVESPLFIDMDREIRAINDLSQAFRAAGWPVIYTVTCYTPPHFLDAGAFGQKLKLLRDMSRDSETIGIDRRLHREEGDYVVEKKFPSGFYGTNVQSLLTAAGIDSVVVTGNSTSGCVRATVVDSVSGGFRTIVVEDGVADRSDLSHEVSLMDMRAKYADILTSEAVLSSLRGVSESVGRLSPLGQ